MIPGRVQPRGQNDPSAKWMVVKMIPNQKVAGSNNYHQQKTADLSKWKKLPHAKKCQVDKMSTCQSGGGQNVPQPKRGGDHNEHQQKTAPRF